MNLNLQTIRIDKLLSYAIATVFVLIPNILYWKQEYSDPFAALHLALAKASLGTHSIATAQSNSQVFSVSNTAFSSATPGMTSLLVTFNCLTNIDFKMLEFLPVMAIILALVAFVFARQMLNSLLLSVVFVIYLAYQPVVHALTYNLLQTGIAMAIYLGFILIYLNMLKKHSEQKELALLFVLFITIMTVYYTFTVFTLIFVFAAGIFNFLSERKSATREKKVPLLYFWLALTVTYFYFDQTFYSTISRLASYSDASNAGILTWSSKFGLIFGSTAQGVTYASKTILEAAVALNRISTAVYAMIALSALLLFAFELYSFHKTRKFYTPYAPLEFAFILTAVAEVIIYISVGFVHFRFVLLGLPLLFLLALDKLKRKNIMHLIVGIFMVLVISQAMLWPVVNPQQFTDTNKYFNIESSSSWLFDNSVDGRTVITDLYTDGKLNVQSAYAAQKFQTILVNAPFIQYINDTASPSAQVKDTYLDDFLMLNTQGVNATSGSISVASGDWQGYTLSMSQLNSSVYTNLVYADGSYSIYKT